MVGAKALLAARTVEMNARESSMVLSVETSCCVFLAAYPSFCNSTTPALMPLAICTADAERLNPREMVAIGHFPRSDAMRRSVSAI
jgi:hypothetical protein